MDVLSDALRVIRLEGSLFLNAEFHEPWCVVAPEGTTLAPILSPAHERVAVCHLVVEGRCWARLPDQPPVELEAGDAVAIPHGDAHLLGSGEKHAPVSQRDAVAVDLPVFAQRRYGGDGEEARVVCGWFAYERHVANPLLAALPRMFRANVRNRASGAWLEKSVRYAIEEAASDRAGARVIADKIAEVLFVEVLRSHLESTAGPRTGWLAGLRDPLVGKSIATLHARPAHAWTVATLAREVGASRSVLAERFTGLVGIPPMQYLTQWRLALAGHLLRTETLTLTRVAEEVGYESEAAFNRAFRREYGMPPGAWRRKASTRSAGKRRETDRRR